MAWIGAGAGAAIGAGWRYIFWTGACGNWIGIGDRCACGPNCGGKATTTICAKNVECKELNQFPFCWFFFQSKKIQMAYVGMERRLSSIQLKSLDFQQVLRKFWNRLFILHFPFKIVKFLRWTDGNSWTRGPSGDWFNWDTGIRCSCWPANGAFAIIQWMKNVKFIKVEIGFSGQILKVCLRLTGNSKSFDSWTDTNDAAIFIKKWIKWIVDEQPLR